MLGRLEYYFHLGILLILISIIVIATLYAIFTGLCHSKKSNFACRVIEKISKNPFIPFINILTYPIPFPSMTLSSILITCFWFFSILGLVILIIDNNNNCSAKDDCGLSKDMVFLIAIVLLLLVLFLKIVVSFASWISSEGSIGNKNMDLKIEMVERIKNGFKNDYKFEIPKHKTCIIFILILSIIGGLFMKPYFDLIPLPKFDNNKKIIAILIILVLVFCFSLIFIFNNIELVMEKLEKINNFFKENNNNMNGGSIKKYNKVKKKRIK